MVIDFGKVVDPPIEPVLINGTAVDIVSQYEYREWPDLGNQHKETGSKSHEGYVWPKETLFATHETFLQQHCWRCPNIRNFSMGWILNKEGKKGNQPSKTVCQPYPRKFPWPLGQNLQQPCNSTCQENYGWSVTPSPCSLWKPTIREASKAPRTKCYRNSFIANVIALLNA